MRLLRFTAAWCQPCKTLAETLKSAQLGIPVDVYDIDENKELAGTYQIRSIPTLILLDDLGREIKRNIGLISRSSLEVWIRH